MNTTPSPIKNIQLRARTALLLPLFLAAFVLPATPVKTAASTTNIVETQRDAKIDALRHKIAGLKKKIRNSRRISNATRKRRVISQLKRKLLRFKLRLVKLTEAAKNRIAPEDGHQSYRVSVYNGSVTTSSEISYPEGDTTDTVSIRPTGFGSLRSGTLTFTLISTGDVTPKVRCSGGFGGTGYVRANETWTRSVNDNTGYVSIEIELEEPGYAEWTLIVNGSR